MESESERSITVEELYMSEKNRREFMKVSAAAVGGVANLAQWGEDRAKEQLEPIEPFSIEVPEAVLNVMASELD